jgi:hypothetical protein
MRVTSSLIRVLGLLFAAGLGLWLTAAPAFASSEIPSYGQPVFSDFDGDNKLDQAELFSNGTQKRIHVTLGNFAWQSLSFDSGVSDRGRLVSHDVDSDGDADLIWVSLEYPRKFVLWLSDGRGNFSLAAEAERRFGALQSLLWHDAEPTLLKDMDGQGLLCILSAFGCAAVHDAPAYRSDTRSCGQLSSAAPISTVFALFPSSIKKRGPPSKLANGLA